MTHPFSCVTHTDGIQSGQIYAIEAASMIKIEATTTIEELSRALSSLGREQLPFALALAATRTAQRIQRAAKTALNQDLDSPTRTTLNSLFLKSATKRKPEATVWFKDAWNSGVPADAYLRPQVYGGKRKHKRFEKALIARGLMKGNQYAIPRPDVLDSNGNVKGSQVMRILSGLGAAETVAGVTANASGSKRSKAKNNKRFFVATIGKASGVWERKQSAFGSGVKLWFLFVDNEPSYKVRYDFFQIARDTVEQHYLTEFTTALDHAIKTAKPKG